MHSGNRGQSFEERAAALIRDSGARVLERNFLARTGEIDIVALEQGCLVFVEVRSRGNPRFSGAAASVDRRKQARLIRSARLYLQARPRWRDLPCRFDVIAFEPPQSGAAPEPQWIRGAFTA
jgi:putative endonuclease